MLNHCIHAIEDFEKLLRSGIFDSWPVSRSTHRDVAGLLDQAVKFELPTDGIVTDRIKSLEIIEPTDLHLPFPVVALEYSIGEVELKPDMIHAKKRISLCLDYAANSDHAVCQQALKYLPQIKDVGGIIVIPCFYSEKHNTWKILAWSCVIFKGSVRGLRSACIPVDGKMVSTRLTICSFPNQPEFLSCLIEKVGFDPIMQSSITDTWDEMMAAITMITALSCSNVQLEDHPAPARLNKNRLKKGKRLFHGHKKIIVVNPGLHMMHSNGTSAMTGRQLRSHLRRGHVRRLNTGKRIWIECCVVNAGKALIANTYRINTLRIAA